MNYFIIVGEASGDLHGSNLIKELKKKDANAKFQFWGGDLMEEAANQKPNKHIKELAFMGFQEVIMKLGRIRKNFTDCKQQIIDFQPDALIMVDYAGFNLRMAKFAKANKINTFFFISPKVWAWKQKRVFTIKKYIDVLFTILPFETEFYKKFDYDVKYVGNPLMDAIEQFKIEKSKKDFNNKKPIIAILPGSRDQEIKRMLPIMIEVADTFSNYNFIIAGAPSFDKAYYEKHLKKRKYEIVFNETYSLLSNSEAALVTSGTASLETALFNIPQVVCYKANQASYEIGKRLVKVKYMSLVNLILGYEAVPELLQNKMSFESALTELNSIVKGGNKRAKILSDYEILAKKVGHSGASKRVAEGIVEFLDKKKEAR